MEGSDNTCFVIMPFGTRKDIDDQEIDFDEIYDHIIKVAVESVGDGLSCVRCDRINESGSIHREMLTHIYEDRVAIVDTSTLNANVFYELGVRHALKRGITVLIRREGTGSPFNIQGLKAINYTTTPAGVALAKEKIRAFIENGLKDPHHVDSLVFDALPGLSVQGGTRKRKRLTQLATFEYSLVRRPECAIGFVTGDRADIKVGDIWVNSENTDMLMDRYYGQSTSATIRFLGARKHNVTGRVVEDTIGEEIARVVKGERVEEAHVVTTGPGQLARNGVKWIFHVASVVGHPREGYRPIPRVERCVTCVFRHAAQPEFEADPPTSILFPIFGTGPGGGDLQEHTQLCVDAAVEALEAGIVPLVTRAWFAVWDDVMMEACEAAVANNHGLTSEAASDGG